MKAGGDEAIVLGSGISLHFAVTLSGIVTLSGAKGPAARRRFFAALRMTDYFALIVEPP